MELIEEMAEAIADRYCTKDAGIVRHNQSLPEARENALACLPVFEKWLRQQPDYTDNNRPRVGFRLADELAAMKDAKRGT